MVEVSATAGDVATVAIKNIAAALITAQRGSALMMFPRPVISLPRCLDASLINRIYLRHSGMRLLAQARNPYSRWWLWIPGSLVLLALRNDGEKYISRHCEMK